MDPEIVERLNEQFREMSDILSQQNASMAAMMKAMNDQAAAANKAGAATKNQTNAADANATATEGLTKKQLAYQKAEEERIQKANEAIARFNNTLDTTIGLVKNLGTAVMDSSPKFQKFNGLIGGAGDAAFDLGRKFGILGTVLGGVVKGFTFLVEKQLEQADNLLKFNDDISKLGAVNSFSTKELLGMAHQVGLTSAELDKLSKPMQSLGSSFKAMGVGSAEATKAFFSMVDVGEETRKEFQRLGYATDEERIQAQAEFVDQMVKSGISLKNIQNSTGGLAKASTEYLKNLTALSEMTGLTVEQQKKEQEIARANMQYQVYRIKLDNQIADAMKRYGADSQQVKDLQAKQKAGEIAIDTAQRVGGREQAAAMAMELMGLSSHIGIAARHLGGFNDEFSNMAKDAKAGTLDLQKAGQYQDKMVEDRLQRIDQLGTAIAYSPDFSTQMGLDAQGEEAKKLTEIRGRGAAGKAAQDKIDQNEKGQGPAATDPAQIARNELTEATRQARIKMDELVASTNPLLGNFGSFALLSGAALAAAAALGVLAFASLAKTGAGLFGAGAKGGPALAGPKGGPSAPAGGGGKGVSAPTNLQSQKDLRMDYARQLRKQGFSPKESLRIARDQYPNSSFAEFNKRATDITKNSQMSKLERLTSRFSSKLDDLGKMSKMSKMGKALGTANKWLGRAAVPLTVLSAGVEGYMGYKAASDQEKAGQITAAEAKKKKGEAIGGAVGGGLGGAAGGALAGAAIGSVVPVIGTAIGGILGGALGYYLGNKAGTAIGGAMASPDAPKPAQKPNDAQESKNRSVEYANTQFTKSIASFGSIVTSFGKIVVAFAITSKAFSTSVRAYAESTNKLGAIVNNIGNKKSDDSEKNAESLFAKTVTIFGSLVTSFGKIITANATVTTAFAISVKAFATTVAKLAEIVRGPQQKNTTIDSVAKALAENKPSERLQRRQSNLENILGNSMLETQDSLSPMERFETSIDLLTTRLDLLREAEIKRHLFNELSMKEFRQSLEDASKKLDKISGVTRDEDKEDKEGASSGGTGAGSSENAQKAMDYFMKQGWSKEQAAGIVGNLQQESGKDLDPSSENSNGMYGIAQWDKTRRREFEKVMGRSIYGSSLEDQLAFIQHELTSGKDRGAKKAGRELKSATSALEAASIFEKHYERSGGSALGKRIANAEALMVDKPAPKTDSGDQGKIRTSESQLSKMGIVMKPGDVHGPNYPLDKRIPELAKKIQESIPNFRYFSAFNDRYHQNLGYNSMHKEGKAFDFTLRKKPTREQGKKIVEQLKRLGAPSAKDEYNEPSSAATAGHMHVQFAAKGGVFDGPTSGYPAVLHGSEMVAPLSTNSILMKLSKTPADGEEVKQAIAPTNTMNEKETVEKLVTMNSEMMSEMLTRLSEMVDAINDGNDTRQKILKNSQS